MYVKLQMCIHAIFTNVLLKRCIWTVFSDVYVSIYRYINVDKACADDCSAFSVSLRCYRERKGGWFTQRQSHVTGWDVMFGTIDTVGLFQWGSIHAA